VKGILQISFFANFCVYSLFIDTNCIADFSTAPAMVLVRQNDTACARIPLLLHRYLAVWCLGWRMHRLRSHAGLFESAAGDMLSFWRRCAWHLTLAHPLPLPMS
jgi:hypothetical protein